MENNSEKQLHIEFAKALAEVETVAGKLPAVVIIHNLKNTSVEYMSPLGLGQLGVTLRELQDMGPEYNMKYFNPQDAAEYVPKIFGLLERNQKDEIISFFQQVRFAETQAWSWHFSTTKIFMRDAQGLPTHSITLAFPIDNMHHITSKVSRLLEENTFLRQNYQNFAKLASREREILKQVAMGKSSQEIADELCISEKTVNTHRRNVRTKLNVNTSFEMTQYARAFDLV